MLPRAITPHFRPDGTPGTLVQGEAPLVRRDAQALPAAKSHAGEGGNAPNAVGLGLADRRTGVPLVREDSASRLAADESPGWKPVAHDRQDACPPAKQPVLGNPPGRLFHLDGMRALAAVAVALFHFRGNLGELSEKLPAAIDGMVRHGYLGVNVFFVLSGFVIAHSLGNSRYSLPFLGRFVARRQVRLAPPYWATVALAAWWYGGNPSMAPLRTSLPTLLAHLGYMQDILGYPQLLDVFWTLCIEVQLYLVYVVLAWLAQSDSARWRLARRDLIFVGATLVSLLAAWVPSAWWSTPLMPGANGPAHWFPYYWYMFALGVWVRWALDRRRDRAWLALFLALACLRAGGCQAAGPLLCAATAALLYLAARWPWLPRVLGCRLFAYFGRISYSFYLLHTLIGGTCIHWTLGHHPHTAPWELAALCAALAASWLAAHALWWAVERPSIRWSRMISTVQRRPEGRLLSIIGESCPKATVPSPTSVEA